MGFSLHNHFPSQHQSLLPNSQDTRYTAAHYYNLVTCKLFSELGGSPKDDGTIEGCKSSISLIRD